MPSRSLLARKVCRPTLRVVLLGLLLTLGLRGLRAEPQPHATPDAKSSAVRWAEGLDRVQADPALAEQRAQLVALARQTAERPIVQRVYRYVDVGKFRTWLDGRARAMDGNPRQSWFALAMSDFAACNTLNSELPVLALAYRWTGEAVFRDRLVAQLEETASWTPLQRPGWSLYAPSGDPVPADFNDGNWLATGKGIRALGDTLEILPPGTLPDALVTKLHALLGKEIAAVVDDWRTERSWFIRANNPRTNQWVLPTEGLVRACLILGREQHAEAYELGVKNLLASLDAQGPHGEFFEGIGYANFTVESLLHAAHAMAVAGDQRALAHPFLRRFPTWMVAHLQPGRQKINCFDSGVAQVARDNGEFRSLLSLFVVLAQDPGSPLGLERAVHRPIGGLDRSAGPGAPGRAAAGAAAVCRL